MTVNPLRSTAGFTYLAALMVVVIMGIMLAAAGQSWKTVMDREREEELLFRGMQYRDALIRWYKQPGGTGQRQRPALNELKDLLKDPNLPGNVRYLRTLYEDPVTGEEWVPIKGGATGGIIGVHSASEKEPIKTANFPKGLEDLEGKTKYSEWQFLAEQAGAAAAPGTVTTGTTGTGTATGAATRPAGASATSGTR